MLKSIPLPAPTGTIHWSRGRIARNVSALLVAVLAFAFSGPLLRQVDATAAPFDLGLLSALAFAAAAVLAAGLMARVLTVALVRHAIPSMVKPLNPMKPWQHLLMLLGLFCSLFWGFMLVLIVLL
ncbi:hypothetical protein [Parapedobacter soli]|uniref:hypothetical protein n=1 Tax=Parapedobacter soli TaxID=416955 RepID=UPI0021C5C013|nr:hypothetical protein [Parapedobacter soli]